MLQIRVLQAGEKRTWEIYILFAQFICEPEAILKNNII